MACATLEGSGAPLPRPPARWDARRMSTSAAVPKPHRGAVYALLAVASIAGFLAIFALWAQRQLLNTDNFTQSSTQLLENPAIRATVADYLVDQLYANVDVTGELQAALPPQFQALAGPAAGGLRTLADRGANEALQRPRVQAVWENASRQAHLALLKVLDGGGPAV